MDFICRLIINYITFRVDSQPGVPSTKEKSPDVCQKRESTPSCLEDLLTRPSPIPADSTSVTMTTTTSTSSTASSTPVLSSNVPDMPTSSLQSGSTERDELEKTRRSQFESDYGFNVAKYMDKVWTLLYGIEIRTK